MISRLLLFIFGIVFNVQVWGYAYDAESLVPNQGNVEFESQYQHYDDIPNLCYRCIDPSVKKLQEKALSESFFAFEVGFVAAKGGGNNLFRVVDDVELSDIQKTGAFRSPAGTLEEGKQFVDNIGDAKALQSKFSKFFGGNQTIVGARAPQSVLNNSTKQPFADIPKGQAITVPVKDLPKVTPNL